MRKKVFLPIFCLIITLFLVQALICNFASAEGVDLAFVKQEIRKLEKENRGLETEIVELSSLTRISSVAGELGFSPAKIVYTSFDLPMAMRE